MVVGPKALCLVFLFSVSGDIMYDFYVLEVMNYCGKDFALTVFLLPHVRQWLGGETV